MNNDATDTRMGEWVEPDAEATESFVSHLPRAQQELLVSDGSLTVELEKLYGGELEVELRLNEYSTLTPEEADYLLVDQECESINREVWLKRSGQRLVFAHTLIPLACLSQKLREALSENADQPIGRVLASSGIAFEKKHLMVGIFECPEVAIDLELVEHAPFVARRYILSNTDFDTNPLIKAVVTEVFSPEVVTPVL